MIVTINQGSASLKVSSFGDDSVASTKLSLGPLAKLPVDLREPKLVLHRIVHGGEFDRPLELTSEVVAILAEWSNDVPLHQPAALARVAEAAERWPHARQVGVFDTAWHRTLPAVERVIAVPAAWRADGCRRFGFHGIAFTAAFQEVSQREPALARGRLVLAHLGGGSSLCGVVDGRSQGTTMGMTPLAGVPMASRAGSIDPGVILRRLRSGDSVSDVSAALWNDSGLKGLSGLSGDMRELLASPDTAASLAVDVFVVGVAQAIAAMGTSIGGIEAIVFSGGIGYGSSIIRRRVIERLAWLGASLEMDGPALERPLSSANSSIAVHAVDVDEAAEMVREWRKFDGAGMAHPSA
jgi:acetate kinase